ncbi:hypothetical protein Dimus_001595, partial [Dionaea muscipula]
MASGGRRLAAMACQQEVFGHHCCLHRRCEAQPPSKELRVLVASASMAGGGRRSAAATVVSTSMAVDGGVAWAWLAADGGQTTYDGGQTDVLVDDRRPTGLAVGWAGVGRVGWRQDVLGYSNGGVVVA